MKKIFVFVLALFVTFSFSSFAQDHDHTGHDHSGHNHDLKWEHNLEKAMDVAKKSGKPIFVDFTGSDWCGWCIKLDKEVFKKSEFIEYAAHNLVLVEIDFPRKTKQAPELKEYNEKLMKKYAVRGFPTILLLNAEGKEIGKTGYVEGGPSNYVKHLKEILTKK